LRRRHSMRLGRSAAQAGESGQEKMGKGGPRKPLKRLDTDKGIKVNAKENPRKIQIIQRIFLGVSSKSKDFQGMRTRVQASPHGTSTAAPSRRPARKSSSAWLALSSGYGVVVVRTFARGARARNSSPSARVRLATEATLRSPHRSR